MLLLAYRLLFDVAFFRYAQGRVRSVDVRRDLPNRSGAFPELSLHDQLEPVITAPSPTFPPKSPNVINVPCVQMSICKGNEVVENSNGPISVFRIFRPG
jgi:hypothetical protein